jgi:hypothetical protein
MVEWCIPGIPAWLQSSYPTMPPATTGPTSGSSKSPPGTSSRTRNEKQLNEKTLGTKLDAFDDWASTASRYLIDWLRDDLDEILQVARARLITGHYVWQDKYMYEYEQGRLQKEVLEELADAIVYAHLFLSRKE